LYFADFSQTSKFDLLLSGTDLNGNTWVVFDFKGTAKFGDILVTSDSLTKYYIAKLDKNGTWLFVKQVSDDKISNLNFDNTGNVILSLDTKLIKLNDAGEAVWSKKVLEPRTKDGGSSVGKVIVAKDNSIFVTGYFYKIVDAGVIKKTSTTGNYDIFVMKMDAEANPVWITTAGGNDEESINDIVEENGSVYITGVFGMTMTGLDNPSSYPAGVTATFGSTTLQTITAKFGELFVAKIDKDGNWLWVKQEDRAQGVAGVTIKETNKNGKTTVRVDNNSKVCGDVVGNKLSLDSSNILLVSGVAKGGMHYYGSSMFGNWGCNSYTQSDINFVAKLNTVSGNWVSAKEENLLVSQKDLIGNTYTLVNLVKSQQSFLSSFLLSKINSQGGLTWSRNTNASQLSVYQNQAILTGVSTGCLPTFKYSCSNTTSSSYDSKTRIYSVMVLYRSCYPVKIGNCINDPLISGKEPETIITNNIDKTVATSTSVRNLSVIATMSNANDPKGIINTTNSTEFATKKGIYIYKTQDGGYAQAAGLVGSTVVNDLNRVNSTVTTEITNRSTSSNSIVNSVNVATTTERITQSVGTTSTSSVSDSTISTSKVVNTLDSLFRSGVITN
ncbi:MAG: hypothetical protein WCO30_02790, partial [bacterium]